MQTLYFLPCSAYFEYTAKRGVLFIRQVPHKGRAPKRPRPIEKIEGNMDG